MGTSFTCSCRSGYTLAADGRSCTGKSVSNHFPDDWELIAFFALMLLDNDECAVGNGGCAQICTNSPGSFTCDCNRGFQRANDGRGCSGQ